MMKSISSRVLIIWLCCLAYCLILIDEEGSIAAVMPKVKPDTNAAEILAMLDEAN